ncbi:MAG: hypothetical protein U1E05_07015 [Patescibacteria group bacterium]|nr:hypothetical protein [Patescibacteria group bacterium]
MGTEGYRRWVPALIIGLILCLPVISWLLGGAQSHPPARFAPPGTTSAPAEVEVEE